MLFKNDVSIIIPVARMSGKLQPLAELINRLVKENVEVIVVHDFHDEGTSLELREINNAHFGKADVILIEDKFGGPGAARNAGLKISTRKYVSFWDSDDYVYLNRFVEFLDQAVTTNTEIGIAEFVINGRNGKKTVNTTGESFEEAFRGLALNPGIWRFLFKKSVISEMEFENFLMGEDQLFVAEAILKVNKILIFRKPIYEYQMFQENQLTSNPKNLRFIIKTLEGFSKLRISNIERTKVEFVAIMYWKMFLTLLTSRGSGISLLKTLIILKNLLSVNPQLFKLVLLEFLNIRNYQKLK
jgi:glycosyltransferase involved in cell wall biosynthesis